jgi:hypothetical protein
MLTIYILLDGLVSYALIFESLSTADVTYGFEWYIYDRAQWIGRDEVKTVVAYFKLPFRFFIGQYLA